MLSAAITFFVIGLIAMVLGAYNVAGLSMEAGRLLLIFFVILSIVSFVAGLIRGRGRTNPLT